MHIERTTNEDHPMAPVWEPCGSGCACNALTSICWGPVDQAAPTPAEYNTYPAREDGMG